MIRVAALTPAFAFASAELMIAKKTSTQPPPQKITARSCQGFAEAVVTFVKPPKPVPITQA